MATLIFDIETVGEEWNSLDEVTQVALGRWALRSARSEEERSSLLADVQAGLGFSPLTGSIVALGIYDRERARGVVYYEVTPAADITHEAFVFKSRSEAGLLQEFWEGIADYDTLVSFNGRAFDVPFILHRSVVCDVRPTRELLGQRYLAKQHPPFHIDLQDELTFYGAMGRRPSLHLFCRAYGILSPKGEVSGDQVAGLYRSGRLEEIAECNARDLLATAALYEKWLQYLAPQERLQDIDF